MAESRKHGGSSRYGLTRRLFNVTVVTGAALAVMAGRAVPTRAAPARRIIVLGDSLSAGYGLPREHAFTARLEAALKAKGYAVTVPPTGVSGETTAGGLARLDWLLADKPDLVIVALGANDGLRGIDPAATRANLDAILTKLRDKGVPALLAGMLAPRNLGREYGEAFDSLYPALAKAHGVAFYPFLLDGVAMDPALNLSDGMHPNAKGVAIMVERILPTVTATLDALGAQPGGAG